MAKRVISVRHLRTSFRVEGQWRPAVDDVSFDVAANETVAIVGESGSGKSVTALSIMGLIPTANGRVEGEILLHDRNLLKLSEREMRKVRGDDISMIFQEPMTSLNPVLTIGFQVAEALRYHRGMDRAEADGEALRILEQVRIPSARSRFHDYPHLFSGGMRQRVMIAMALACEPALLIADEPTTALDVTVQAQILALLKDLQRRMGMAMLFITHDLGVVAELCDEVIVMYAGRIAEHASVIDLFQAPRHPYTHGLIRSIPTPDMPAKSILPIIEGVVPQLSEMPAGCRFSSRCEYVDDLCRREVPAQLTVGNEHEVSCHHWERLAT